MRSATPRSSVFGFRRGPRKWLWPERPKRNDCWRKNRNQAARVTGEPAMNSGRCQPRRERRIRGRSHRAFFLISKTVASQDGGQRVEIAPEPSLYLVEAALESNRLRLA